MQTFISEDLALMISQVMDFLLRKTWQPSVLSIDTVGHFPLTCERRVREGRGGGGLGRGGGGGGGGGRGGLIE